jgi:integrase
MSSERAHYQRGNVEFRAATNKYYFRYRLGGRRRALLLGTADELSSTAKLNRAVDEARAKVNREVAQQEPPNQVLMSKLIERYKADRMPKRYSTAKGYASKIDKHILPQWGATSVSQMMNSAYEVEQWLKQFKGAPKSKVHLRGLLSILLEHAMLLRIVPLGRNPMELVRVEGASKRNREPKILTYEQFGALLQQLREPYRTMAVLAGGLGLRCSEVSGLQWWDVDFEQLSIMLRRGVVNGHEGEVKTAASNAVLPIDPDVGEAILRWRNQTSFRAPTDWVFASPLTVGRRPYHMYAAQYDVLSPAAKRAGLGRLGWHDLRHSYRTWLDQTGAPLGVQKDLMRHASITTTMNIYGRAVPEAKREAHGKVVMMLREAAGTL